ncbi:MAG: FAD-dependent oxidoreductase, partial [Chloroflexota bacterium]
IGVASAYYLATQHNLTNILLVDKHPPLSQTSAKSGENYRNWWPNPIMVDFINRSIDMMEGLAQESNNLFNLTRRGYAYVTADPVALNSLETTLNHYQSLPLGTIRYHKSQASLVDYAPITDTFTHQPDGADALLDSSLIQQTFPHFDKQIQAIIHARRCGALSAQQLGIYLLEQAKKQGLQMLRGTVSAIDRDEQGVKAVTIETDQGPQRVETRAFINAAGPFASQIAKMVEIELPVYSVFQQKIAVQDPLGIVPRHMPFTIFMDTQYLDWSDEERDFWQTEAGYQWLLERFPGGLHIKPEGTGDSTWLKLGWAFNQSKEIPQWERQANPEFPDIVMRGASKLIPGLKAYINNLPQPVVQYGGYYTKTRENLPLIGPTNISGMFLATAFSGFGTMASCGAGELIAAWVAGTTLPPYAKQLSLSRYDDPAFIKTVADIEAQGEL